MHQRTRAVCCVANNLDPQRLLTARLVQRFPACGHPFSRDMGAATSANSADALPSAELGRPALYEVCYAFLDIFALYALKHFSICQGDRFGQRLEWRFG